MNRNEPFDATNKRVDLLHRLNKIQGINLTRANITKFPQIPLSSLVSTSAFEQFKKAIAWAIEQVKSAQDSQRNDASL